MITQVRFATVVLVIALVGAFAAALPAAADAENEAPAPDEQSFWDEERFGPLPRWREGGTPEPPPGQSLHPRAILVPATKDAPSTGLVASPPEYSPSDGVLFRYSTSSWSVVVTDLVAALTGDPAHDEIA